MAINFEAIRQKLANISGQNKKRNVFWRPEVGKETIIRIIPLPNTTDGAPFLERSYYYNIGGPEAKRILAPSQFGKRDPIKELANKLWEENSPTSRELAKKLFARVQFTAAVIVRGEEDKGIRLWSFGKTVCQALYGLMLDEDYGDITDIKSGRDIKVTVTQQGGKHSPDTTITPKPNQTSLNKDPEQVKKWLEAIPDPTEFDYHLSPEDIEKRIDAWLNPKEDGEAGDEEKPAEAPAGDEGTRREGTSSKNTKRDDVDDAIEELKPKGRKGKSVTQTMDELDAAFASDGGLPEDEV